MCLSLCLSVCLSIRVCDLFWGGGGYFTTTFMHTHIHTSCMHLWSTKIKKPSLSQPHTHMLSECTPPSSCCVYIHIYFAAPSCWLKCHDASSRYEFVALSSGTLKPNLSFWNRLPTFEYLHPTLTTICYIFVATIYLSHTHCIHAQHNIIVINHSFIQVRCSRMWRQKHRTRTTHRCKTMNKCHKNQPTTRASSALLHTMINRQLTSFHQTHPPISVQQTHIFET